MPLSEIRKLVDSKLHRKQYTEELLADAKVILKELKLDLKAANEGHEVFKESALAMHEFISIKLSDIVTKAIRTIFEENLTFECTFVERRNTAECDLRLFNEEGEEVDILEGDGGGLADCIAMFLRFSYLELTNQEKIILLDEPLKHLDVQAQKVAGQVLHDLSKELNIKIVMITHSPILASYAEKQYNVTKVGGISQVREV